MKHMESTLYIPLWMVGLFWIAVGLIMLFLLLFVLKNPISSLGWITYCVAVFMVGYGCYQIHVELIDSAAAMGYDKPKP